MPRVEIMNGDSPSPTVDLCLECYGLYIGSEGSDVPDDLQDEFFEGVIGSTEVEHPSYDDGRHDCRICGVRLDIFDT